MSIHGSLTRESFPLKHPQVVGKTYFLKNIGLRSLFSCFLSAGDGSQLLQASQVLIMLPPPQTSSRHDYQPCQGQTYNLSHPLNLQDFRKGQISLVRTHLIRPGPPGILSLFINLKLTKPWEFSLPTRGLSYCIYRFHPHPRIIKRYTSTGGNLGGHFRVLPTTS